MNVQELKTEFENAKNSFGYESADSREFVDHSEGLRGKIQEMRAIELASYYGDVPCELAAIIVDTTSERCGQAWAEHYLRSVAQVCGRIDDDFVVDEQWCDDTRGLMPRYESVCTENIDFGKSLDQMWDEGDNEAQNLLMKALFIVALHRK